ncbi:RNA-binding protein YlmH, contains S4-like domain [Clostridium sp. USBA 49]|jgi:RNA-binding protein YlmH|uniref:YlmH family RNA-binding protein n=1 Tax=Clostridium TaxID=1485 RepID=UPI000999B154|nr:MULTISPECIES: YlmH/Sll1252 family protein [Clostridium]SKA76964.1 RNA-binding protein YlmH, contains S4-like domain [Clostridium sp. USBA 49]
MDKKTFLNFINYEDKNILSNIYNKLTLAEKANVPVFINEFYPPNLWKNILNLQDKFNVKIYANGIFEEAERKMLAFFNDIIYSYPINVIKIKNKSKFQKLEHRDYLGAIIGLGIKREKFGDLIIKDDICYGTFCKDISYYVISNLNYVGKCPCTVELVNENEYKNIKANTENLYIITTSLRLDSVVGSLCNISRSKAVSIINNGKVLVDYNEIYEKDKSIELNTVITIRGYGKFKIINIIGSTQKGRLKLQISKYV